MQYQIELQLHNQPAVLERVLQVVRYRQFHLEGMQMQPEGQDKLTVQLKVSGQHSINILTSQLNKLYDLARLTIQHEMPLKATA
ncbi:acetolactate synthase 2 small subunit [Planctobacterium marinum]|uniref:acetolactate synthase 2 small subunit n=1 Tax=Planctobacterium marinum TaxID=1631968 RepID=UPI001E5322EC|nr:acetolactate synthase 2 small subunit [Planctobacterium marinum]MCC2606565.1 acetolactate synthase 2 small subunit [Planctobacterium marinum]